LGQDIINGPTLVQQYGYRWDAGGNLLAITNNGTSVTRYAFDAAGQLTNEISPPVTNSWRYDEAGNWLNAGGGAKWVYNADNELLAKDSPDDTNWSEKRVKLEFWHYFFYFPFCSRLARHDLPLQYIPCYGKTLV
jgi:YD repeat-containing protein